MPRLCAIKSVWTEICMKCSCVFLPWWHQIFSITILRGIRVSSLNVPEILAIGYSNLYFELLMQSIFTSYVFRAFQFFNPCKYWKITLITSENRSVRFQCFHTVNCLLMFYSIDRSSCVLNDINWAFWCTWSLVAPAGAKKVFLAGGN